MRGSRRPAYPAFAGRSRKVVTLLGRVLTAIIGTLTPRVQTRGPADSGRDATGAPTAHRCRWGRATGPAFLVEVTSHRPHAVPDPTGPGRHSPVEMTSHAEPEAAFLRVSRHLDPVP